MNAWRDSANCKGKLDLFYAAPSERPPVRDWRIAQAKQLCAACPVREQCLEAGHEDDRMMKRIGLAPEGIWGGLTGEERRRIHRQQPQRERQAS